MNEIENKLNELWETIQNVGIPDECKGETKEASKNRWRYLKIRGNVAELINKTYGYGD